MPTKRLTSTDFSGQDLAGNKFGRLTAIAFHHTHRFKCGRPEAVWDFKCDCGNNYRAGLPAVRKGLTISCGCYRSSKQIDYTSLSGRRFSKLTAVREVGVKEYESGTHRIWLFVCDCGNLKEAFLQQVISGQRKSCGCLKQTYYQRYSSIGKKPITQRECYLKHRIQRLTDAAEYRKDNVEKLREIAMGKREYYRIKSSERRAKDPARYRKSSKLYREKNKIQIEAMRATPEYKAKMVEYSHQYYLRNRHKVYLKVMLRKRMLKIASKNLQTIKEWQDRQREKKTFVCYWCDKRLPVSMMHFDHIIPVIKGGWHSPENLCTSCQPCNNSKCAKLPQIWFRLGQQVMHL